MMLDKDDYKKLAVAGLLYKFFLGRKSPPAPPADPSYRPRYFRRWLVSLIILVSIPFITFWIYEVKIEDTPVDTFHDIFGEKGEVLGGWVVFTYVMFVLFFILWTFWAVLATLLGVISFLFRKVF